MSRSSRGTVPGLATPHPLGAALPAVYAEDEFGQRFVAGLDVVLAPLFHVLDSLAAYFSPALAPDDFVDYLATWVGAEPAGIEPPELRRQAVASAVALHRVRGTRRGLALAVRLAFGVMPEITESGGASWSVRPLGPFPGAPEPGVHVTLRVADPAAVDPYRLRAVVAAARPAHLPFTVAVTPSTRTSEGARSHE
ncbi:phage tail protein [Streptomyces sp. NPDC003943]